MAGKDPLLIVAEHGGEVAEASRVIAKAVGTLKKEVRDNAAALTGVRNALKTDYTLKIGLVEASVSTLSKDVSKRLASANASNAEKFRGLDKEKVGLEEFDGTLRSIADAIEGAKSSFAEQIDDAKSKFSAQFAQTPAPWVAMGAWDAGEKGGYPKNAVVSWLGSSFVSLVAGNTEKPSARSKKWQLLARRGGSGSDGAAVSAGTSGGGGGSGTVVTGAANQLAYYTAANNSLSGLPTVANRILVSDVTGVPTWTVTLPSFVLSNTITFGVAGTPMSGTSSGLLVGDQTATAASSAADRLFNVVGSAAVVKVLRTGSGAPTLEFQSRSTANTADQAYWDIYATSSNQFFFRNRLAGIDKNVQFLSSTAISFSVTGQILLEASGSGSSCVAVANNNGTGYATIDFLQSGAVQSRLGSARNTNDNITGMVAGDFGFRNVQSKAILFSTDNGTTVAGGFLANNGAFQISYGLNLSKTITAAGTTGAQTINKSSGSVNLAAAATSLVVTNSLVTANSNVLCTVSTNDSTCKSVIAVPTAGSFTMFPNAAPTAETRVTFIVTN